MKNYIIYFKLPIYNYLINVITVIMLEKNTTFLIFSKFISSII